MPGVRCPREAQRSPRSLGADGGIAPLYGTFTYSVAPLPAFTISGGMVNVTDTIQVAGGPYYQGFGKLCFNGN